MAQRCDGSGGFFTGVDQVFGESTDNAVASGVDLANFVFMLACGFN